MELILSIAGAVISFGAAVLFGIIAFVFKDNINMIRDNQKEFRREVERLDTQFRIFENEKYNELMNAIGEIKIDIAVIKQKIDKQ